ncbi:MULTISPECIES: pitrilysin family protein [Paenarthrobacter]|jgi:predicted Zn-dependent peptidase|uniref:M16 family metallopeptidase n=1 Tax=Paenarthrobacter TaxID=1742992 RepID=UPI00037CD8FD|nr:MULTISPECIES: pitrilysin family protein [Paenarthrobacter]KIA73720.1 Zn-dependent peptidase [Arthrobacter sp. MWB30]KQQ97915.1 zinc protease [Arthrobacter sp. Leaf145]SKB89043.1 Predicted Zn-dependent peptidase [Arthrobacter sp. 31Cvi3.1E]BCW10220.1 putative zinc protease [Arthrobacter sp. NtRootA2]BCW14300.1 putative zinc protease [Arthrobacter sp. NtRootA4]BCW22636.1 putative zinc protease [Arthrobacter sp. NtRootC7]BCW26905.1 putative zinc protease [Arthrobacter sp. NtRootC45]BCW31175
MTVVPLPLEQTLPGGELIHGAEGGSVVRRSVLPGGVRVLTEAMPGQRSATIGFWVAVGSRDEAEGQHGSTHFLEHLLFKGTKRRTALEIASAFDEVGGESNAATAKESTCYFARVLDTDLPMAIDVIADMITGAVLDPAELEQERDVILEEIAMDSDDPTDVAHEKFVAAVLGDHPLARPIGGTPEAIKAVARDSVWEHYQRYYRPEELVITAAGGLDHDVVCGLVLDALTAAGWKLDSDSAPVNRRGTGRAVITGTSGLHVVKRPVEQANIIMGCPTIVATDDRRFVMSVLNAVLGGGMSSRLFQEIREKRGLVYSTYSFTAAYADAGYFGMYAGCTPSKVRQVVELLGVELDKLAEDGITEDELRKAVGQLSGGIVLALEDTGSRMSRLGRAELVSGEFQDIDETLARIQAVTVEEVRDLARELAGAPRTITVVGPFEESETFGL